MTFNFFLISWIVIEQRENTEKSSHFLGRIRTGSSYLNHHCPQWCSRLAGTQLVYSKPGFCDHREQRPPALTTTFWCMDSFLQKLHCESVTRSATWFFMHHRTAFPAKSDRVTNRHPVARNCHGMAAMVIQRVWVRGQWEMRGRPCDAIRRASSTVLTYVVTRRSLQLWMISGRGWQLQCTQSMFACMDQHVDQSMFHCLLCLNQCALACAWTASVCFESDRLPAKKKDLIRGKPVQLASETYDNTLRRSLALLECFEAPWRSRVLLLPGASISTVMVKKGSVPIMANFEPFFLRFVNECGAEFWWKYSQDTALQEIPRRNSVLHFWAGLSSKLPWYKVQANFFPWTRRLVWAFCATLQVKCTA